MENLEITKHGMKAKSIKGRIHRKISLWLDTVEDKDLQARLKSGVIVTGGSIASMLLGEEVNDFDVYLRNQTLAYDVAKYYVSKFEQKHAKGIKTALSVVIEDGRVKVVVKSAGIASEEGTEKPYQYFEGQPDESAAAYVGDVITDPEQIADTYEEIESTVLSQEEEDTKYVPRFLTTNAITLSGKIQIVLRFYGEPDTIHENYDFVHCTNYWSSWDNNLALRQPALEALLSKELRYVGSRYPICSLVRLRKFIQRGWRVNAGQVLKMAFQISELNLKDIKVLEDQLTGVDTAYFIQLIDRLKQKDPEKVDGAYLIEIIDRIF
jgi:hypothetical protein